jgi:NAD(P)-dependent dehydrogenase (short-subunit alcohol dehydrogenase family)
MLDDESWDAVLDVNLRAAAILTKELTPSLLDAGPGSAIVYLSSIEAFFGNDFLPAYSASKAGLLGLTRSAAHTLGPHGIRVNSVCPGAVDTPLLAPLLEIEGMRANLEGRTPLQRLAVPDDIAKVVRFLLSDEAGYVSGASLVVDGGLTAISGI